MRQGEWGDGATSMLQPNWLRLKLQWTKGSSGSGVGVAWGDFGGVALLGAGGTVMELARGELSGGMVNAVVGGGFRLSGRSP